MGAGAHQPRMRRSTAVRSAPCPQKTLHRIIASFAITAILFGLYATMRLTDGDLVLGIIGTSIMVLYPPLLHAQAYQATKPYPAWRAYYVTITAILIILLTIVLEDLVHGTTAENLNAVLAAVIAFTAWWLLATSPLFAATVATLGAPSQ